MTTTADLYEEWARRYAETPELDRDFRTLSGDEVKPLYTEADLPDAEQIGVPGRVPLHPRRVPEHVPRAASGRCASSPASGPRRRPTSASATCSTTASRGCRTAFDMPSLMGHDSDHRMSLGEVGREGVAIDTPDDMQTLFQGIDLGETSVSMTINAPAAIMMAYYVVAAERSGVPRDRLAGTVQADILKEYIAQKEWCFPVDPAMRLMGDLIEWCTEEMPLLAPGLDLRLPHPRGRLDRRAGARLHAQGRPHLRRAGHRPRHRRRRLRPAAELLLQRADRLLRGDRQVPRRPPHLGARAQGDLRRGQPALVADALPHPDRGRLADRPAAAQQHRPHGDRGAGRRARRHPVAAHQLLRRGARAAERDRGPRRAAHAAGDRQRDRRHLDHRPARRLLRRRGADRRDGAPVLRLLRQDRPARRHGQRGQGGLPAARDRGGLLRAAAAHGPRRAHRRRRQRVHGGRGRRARDAAHRPRARAQADRPPPGRPVTPRRRRPSRTRSPRSAAWPTATATCCPPSSPPPRRTCPRARSWRRSRRSGAPTARRPSSSGR